MWSDVAIEVASSQMFFHSVSISGSVEWRLLPQYNLLHLQSLVCFFCLQKIRQLHSYPKKLLECQKTQNKLTWTSKPFTSTAFSLSSPSVIISKETMTALIVATIALIEECRQAHWVSLGFFRRSPGKVLTLTAIQEIFHGHWRRTWRRTASVAS